MNDVIPQAVVSGKRPNLGTKYAEIIYETGSKSVVSYDDVASLQNSLRIQNDRAIAGSPGGPTGHSAERIKKVLLYNEHPGDLYDSGLLSAEEVKTQLPQIVDDLTIGGQVSIWEVMNRIRGMVSPLTNAAETGPHDSMYLASETGELPLDFLTAKEGTA